MPSTPPAGSFDPLPDRPTLLRGEGLTIARTTPVMPHKTTQRQWSTDTVDEEAAEGEVTGKPVRNVETGAGRTRHTGRRRSERPSSLRESGVRGGTRPYHPGPTGYDMIEKPPAPAQSRANVGAMPSSSVTTTPNVMAAVVNVPGTLTVGPSSAGLEKYISTTTRR